MTTCMHFMHPPKIYKFDKGVMIIFVSGKKRPLLLAKGVHWCLMFMCTLHLWPGTWDTSQRKFMTFHQLSQKMIYLDWLDFLCIRYMHTNVYTHWLFFSFWKYVFFCWEKKLPNLEPHPTHRHVMNELPITSICDCDWLIDEIYTWCLCICRVPPCFKLQLYG